MIELDGSHGEGGGQTLRTSLSLSCLTGIPFCMHSIRAKRPTPGLQAQHLTSVNAAAHVSGAKVSGNHLHSTELSFSPEKISPGAFSFDCGTAGSTVLIAQTLLPILAHAPGPSSLTLVGGTENLWAPTSLYFTKVFLPLLKKMGVHATARIEQFGWFPKGGGRLLLDVHPAKELSPLVLSERGSLSSISGMCLVSNLPSDITERAKTRLLKNLTEAGVHNKPRIERETVPALCEGMEVFLCAEYERSLAGFTALGERGKPTEKVAGAAFHDFMTFHQSGASVDVHAADQLLLYCALAKGSSEFTCPELSGHLQTNADVIRKFLPECAIAFRNEGPIVRVTVKGKGI